MSYLKLYIGSDNVLEVNALTNTVTGEFEAGASIEVTITDSEGVEVAGQSWPVTLDHVEPEEGEDETGNYRANLSDTLEVTEGALYSVAIVANVGSTKRRWKKSIKAVYG